MAGTELTRTTSSTDTGTKFTHSVWLKRATTGAYHKIYHASNDSNTYSYIDYTIANDDKLDFQIKNGDGTTFVRRRTNRVFRDTSAWYHIVARYDSTQSTASDRIRLYVNGELQTSIDQDSTPDCPLNYTSQLALSGVAQNIGSTVAGSDQFFDGIMSHYHLCVGYSYAPTEFGETDATTGEWKIKTSPSVSYGNNGFLILKDGNTITDQSPNSNDWTLAGGTLTKTEDCPSNVFPTMNPLIKVTTDSIDFINGNLSKNNATGDNWRTIISTLAATSGKYYWEQKVTDTKASNPRNIVFGVVDINQFSQTTNQELYATSRGYGYNGNVGEKNNGGSGSSYGDSFTTNDIIGVALDLDNNKIYFSKNGTWQNSGDPTSGATGTGAAFSITDGYYYTPAFSSYHSDDKYSVNFGNGYFGTTAVSSAGTNASGNGIFEYDVPTGYTALSTKGLNL